MALVGCNKKSPQVEDPQNLLRSYISKSFTIQNDEERKELEAYLTGNARARLASWSDAQFRKAFIESKRQFVRLDFRDRDVKKISDREVSVTYELSYMDRSKNSDVKITNKKMAYLVKEGDRWLIQEVRNLKELVEYKNEMSLP